MTELPDNSVHCVVTSPPYYGLRKYHENKLIYDNPNAFEKMEQKLRKERIPFQAEYDTEHGKYHITLLRGSHESH